MQPVPDIYIRGITFTSTLPLTNLYLHIEYEDFHEKVSISSFYFGI